MLWFFLMLLVLYAAFLQADLQVNVHHFDTTSVHIRLYCAGLRKTWKYHLSKTSQGHRLHRTDPYGTKPVDPSQLHQSNVRALFSLLRRTDKAKKFLLSHLHLEKLDALLLLRTGDAAHSALLSGSIQGITACLPAALHQKMHIRVLPEFFRPHSTVHMRCIIRFRLGTIILTAVMLLIACIRQQHLTESEEKSYGTSHR